MSVAVAEPFTPACMDADELAAWTAMRDRSTSQFDRSASPCTDCRLAFAIEMRAAGTCNGSPHGVEEDEDMDLSKIPNVQAEPTRSVTLDVMPPPCASCAHESVCSLRTAVETMSTHKMAAPSLPDGLRLTLVAGVECDHFLRAAGLHPVVLELIEKAIGTFYGAQARPDRDIVAAIALAIVGTWKVREAITPELVAELGLEASA